MRNSILIVTCLLLSACVVNKNRVNGESLQSQNPTAADTSKTKLGIVKKGNDMKLYKEIVTSSAKTDSGLFIVHLVEGRYFFEMPNSLLARDFLIVNRISKAAADIRPNGGFVGFSGDDIGNQVYRFEKGPNHKLFMKTVSYRERSNDSTENGMYRTLKNSSVQPIVANFDIKAYTSDSSGFVVDVTDYVNGDNLGFSFSALAKKSYALGGLQADKSYIIKLSSFPLNVEIQALKTFSKSDGGMATYELNTSIVLLPENPMQPRTYDARVGYFSESYLDFDAPQQLKYKPMITRWRLEPKKEDVDKYLKGELVEPIKPIVFYIDPTTPKKWVPYLIQGVNDWQKAFEKAGFKNAIYALEAPKNNPEWSLYDARHSAIIYKPSAMLNASGPEIHDPRTGEILESHVNWYHNIVDLLKSWYMIQAGVNDKRGQKLIFDEKLMGQLIRFVSSHEIGHTLGLAHNFGASSTIPVEKLRDKKWVEANGHTPSIMDYARFNYVAQPQDSINEKGIFPRIGIYDEWAIEWGYRWFPSFSSSDAERTYMSEWASRQLKKDKRFWYGPQPFMGGATSDPRTQSEDLGDDAMKASTYGILNLKRTMTSLEAWTTEPYADYTELKKMREQVVLQYQRYIGHVLNNVGLSMWTDKIAGDLGDVVTYPSRQKTGSAIAFLNRELFETPRWIYRKSISSKIGIDGKMQPIALQAPVLNKLISVQTYANLSVWPDYYPLSNLYSFKDLMRDLEDGIFKELRNFKPIDFHRRSLQKAYVDRLISSSNAKSAGDFQVIMKAEVRKLLSKINSTSSFYNDVASKQHLLDLKEKLKNALDPKVPTLSLPPSSPDKAAFAYYTKILTCWEDKINP